MVDLSLSEGEEEPARKQVKSRTCCRHDARATLDLMKGARLTAVGASGAAALGAGPAARLAPVGLPYVDLTVSEDEDEPDLKPEQGGRGQGRGRGGGWGGRDVTAVTVRAGTGLQGGAVMSAATGAGAELVVAPITAEQRRVAELRCKEKELCRKEDELRRKEEELQRVAELRRKEEELRRKDEERQRVAELRRKDEELSRKEEELRERERVKAAAEVRSHTPTM
jgi:hypothetical protein